MATENIDLNQSAVVLWLPVNEVPIRGIIGGEQKQFSSLRDAILFVMETLPLRDRATAWITLHAGSLQIDMIQKLYCEMKHKEGD